MRVFTVNANEGCEGNYYTGMCPTLLPFFIYFSSLCVFDSAASVTPAQRQQPALFSRDNELNLHNHDLKEKV